MKIYDCFPFFNELDLLEIRLNELYDTVDYFVIVEGEKTQQNQPKPLYYLENKERYAKFKDKIIHVVINGDEFTDDSAYNEDISFAGIIHGLEQTNATDEDIVLVSCADEIIKSQVILELAQNYTRPLFIEVHNFCYYLNTQFAEGDLYWWVGPLISVGHLKQFNGQVKRCFEWGRSRTNPASSQLTNIPLPHGWHFTFMGNAKDVKNKSNSYIHTEFNHMTEDDFQKSIDNLLDPFQRSGAMSHKFVGIYPTEGLPTHVQKNLEKFEHMFKK